MNNDRSNERGSARLKFLIVMAIFICALYGGYLYVPVAYQAYVFKDLMQHYVDVAATQGYKPSWAGEQLLKSETEYEIPSTAVITPTSRDNRVEVRVQYSRPVEFPGYTYEYNFDYTAKSTAFLNIK
jgi:hypothetical protein